MTDADDAERERDWLKLPEPSAWERFWSSEQGRSYRLVRFLMLRLLGLVYLAAFSGVIAQGPGLMGSHGLTPAASYLERIEDAAGSRASGFLELPSIFWLHDSDAYLSRVGIVGTLLSIVVLFGYANAVSLAILWFLYLSIVHIGQDWYAFGWEFQLLETGFLAIFLCPLLDGRPFAARPPPVAVIWLYRWLIFRVMLGAGLIKLRGDACWTDLTCLVYHYETQPNPGRLSPWFHFLPAWAHKIGLLFSHLCEVVAPFFAFGPRPARLLAGALFIVFQLLLMASGNYSFLNWLTVIPALACLDDDVFPRFVPRPAASRGPHRAQIVAALALVAVVALSSFRPVANLLSSRQVMNTSFGRLHLVNTYGFFGSVGRERYELVIEGTTAERPDSADAVWRAYEFPCKPTSLDRRPCLVTPYHYRLDWLLWFAAMGTPRQYPWTANLVWKLLENEPEVLTLVEHNPFPDEPPTFIRVDRYRYHFVPPWESAREGGLVWRRERLSEWLPPLSRDDPRLVEFLEAYGYRI